MHFCRGQGGGRDGGGGLFVEYEQRIKNSDFKRIVIP